MEALIPGRMVIYLRDVSSPPTQAGAAGETKIIDKDITLYHARLLYKAGIIRPIETGQIDDVLIELGLKESEQADREQSGKDYYNATEDEDEYEDDPADTPGDIGGSEPD